MSGSVLEYAEPVVTAATKGWRVREPLSAGRIRRERPALAGLPVSWPLVTVDGVALQHNIDVMAQLCATAGAELAPHLKTTMAPLALQAQLDAGAWGATVATPAQARTAMSWGTRRVLLANELVDAVDAADLLDRVAALPGCTSGPEPQLWCYVDSTAGIAALASVPAARSELLGVLVELGVPGGRTGVRTVADGVDVARAAGAAGLRVLGVAGYEGSVTSSTTPADLAKVADYLQQVRELAAALLTAELLADPAAPVVISAGGSSFVDVVLDVLPAPLPGGAPIRAVLRSGAYVAHDHGLYRRTDPLARLAGGPQLRPAVRVVGQVVSVPEPGLALVAAGRRDVPFDQDLPLPMLVHPAGHSGGASAARTAVGRSVRVDDQHLYLRDEPGLVPGDLVTFGISHPCTLFDKWRILPVLEGEQVVDLMETFF